MAHKLKALLNKPVVRQFIGFGLVGVTNTAVAYGVYSLLVWLHAHYLLASVISFVVSVAWSYMLNSRFVFKEEDSEPRVWWKTLMKSYISYAATGLLLANVLLFVWIDLMHISKYIAPIINLVFTIPINFALNKYWAYRSRKSPSVQ